jgi:hypothetical protein
MKRDNNRPPVEGIEKEIMDSLKQSLIHKDLYDYFDAHRHYLQKFAKHAGAGKQMIRERMLYLLSEFYLSGNGNKNNAIALYALIGIFEELKENDLTGVEDKWENYTEMVDAVRNGADVFDITRLINPEFPDNGTLPEIGLRYLYWNINSTGELWEFFNRLLPGYEKRGEELCATICFGMWNYFAYAD